MKLYHGSGRAGIEQLRPNLSNHDKPYVYLTHSEELAALYSHNPLTRPNGFFTYWWGKDGVLHYDEYFENQMQVIYAGQKGYVYECEGTYPKLEKMPWVYVSQEDVPVTACTEISDVYERLLRYEREGSLIVQRWTQVSQEQRQIWENVVRKHLQQTDLTSEQGKEYGEFVKLHFRNWHNWE